MFHRMHGEASEGFHVRVPVVEGVNVLVEGLDVDEAVGKIEMELSLKRHQDEADEEHCQVPFGTTKGFFVTQVADPLSGAAVDVSTLPD